MIIQDCTALMSQLFLGRIVDSIIKEDIPKGDEEELRKQINKYVDELSSFERISKSIELHRFKRSHRVLIESILVLLLESIDQCCQEHELFNKIVEYEKKVVKEAKSKDAFSYSDENSIDIYKTVLEVALEDKDVNEREFVLLEKLRKKLGISRSEHRFLEVILEMYPKEGNKNHSLSEFNEAVKLLQTKGVLFQCNKSDPKNLLVIPDEIVPAVKKLIGFELKEATLKILLERLSASQLYDVLKNYALPVAGTKSEKIDRIVKAGIKASEVLENLSNKDLTDLCRKLKGINVTGTKEEKIARIINYFSSLSNKQPETHTQPRELYYQYYEELASRNNKELLNKKIITKDKQIESYFEKATEYIFEEKFGLEIKKFEGTEKPDGAVVFGRDELLMWDNKSKEKEYNFPKSHANQFKRYIRNSTKRVNLFLIIVSEASKSVEKQAKHLKFETDSDTDIAIISARDLKYIAENWVQKAKKNSRKLDPRVFNYTGILTRDILDDHVKILLS